MCKIGDIIVINDAKIGNQSVGKHSFVVLSTDKGEIEGLSFDLVCNLMSSLEGKGDEYKQRKLSYPENMPYSAIEENIYSKYKNGKEGFIKAGVYFLFNKEQTNFKVIGNVDIELYLRLMAYINQMNPEDIKYILDNLS